MKLFNFLFYGLIGSLLLLGVAMEGYGQDDIRVCEFNCAQSSYSVTSVYLSDINGSPLSSSISSCTPGELIDVFISFNYISNRGSSVFNTRIFGDINIGGTIIPINYFYGELTPARQGARITLDDFPFVYTCGDPISLENALVVWTTNNQTDLSGDYTCDDYPPVAQCSFQSILPVGGVPISASFDYFPGCTVNGENLVQLNSVIRGGSPPYNISWTFTGADITSSDEPFPTVNFGSGGGSASLVVTSGTPAVSTPLLTQTIIIPEEMSPSLLSPTITHRTSELVPNGSILLDIPSDNIENYEFTWSFNGEFYSNDKDIFNLLAGEYSVFVRDENTLACRLFTYVIEEDFSALPVIYNSIEIKFIISSKIVNFSWSTTKEWEASHFEIERAVQGIQFEKAGEVKAAGWSDQIQEYVFEDKSLPLTGGNLLYRLKQVDFNGDYHYSEVLSVRVPGVEFTSGVWRAYPNPTDGNALRISLLDASQYNNEPLTFRLIHPMVQSPAMTLPSEMELNDVLTQMTARIPKGVFVVEIQWGQKVEHIKVLKQ